MIRYALACSHGHEFEAWFPDSEAYDAQAEGGLIACPVCGDTQVRKQIMAPAVASAAKRKGPTKAQQEAMRRVAAKVRDHIAETHDYVGPKFAEEARAIHHGETEARPIYGEATPKEAKALKSEGVEATALPPAFAPTPPKKLN